ncbi:hypothetical protein D3C71_1845330 [compost metagenome]
MLFPRTLFLGVSIVKPDLLAATKALFLDRAKLLHPFLFRAKDECKPVGEVSSSYTGGKTHVTDVIFPHIILAVCIDQTAERFFAAGG